MPPVRIPTQAFSFWKAEFTCGTPLSPVCCLTRGGGSGTKGLEDFPMDSDLTVHLGPLPPFVFQPGLFFTLAGKVVPKVFAQTVSSGPERAQLGC